MIDELKETFEENIKIETKEVLSKIWKRVVTISFIINIVLLTALFFSVRDNSSLSDGLAKATELAAEFEKRSIVAEAAAGLASRELSEALDTVRKLEAYRDELTAELDYFKGTGDHIRDGNSNIEDISEEFGDILGKYDIPSSKVGETE